MGPTTSRYVALAIVAAALTSCATGAQREAETMRANIGAATAQRKACTDAVFASPGFDPLRSHIPVDVTQASLEQKMDTNFATDAEAKAILTEHPLVQACKTAFLNQLATTHPTIVPILAAQSAKGDDLLIGVVQKKITWGDYVRRMADLAADTRLAVNAEGQQIDARLQEENREELAQRQAAAEAFAQAAQAAAAQQQAILAQQRAAIAASRPVITNCNQLGTMTNCVTQ